MFSIFKKKKEPKKVELYDRCNTLPIHNFNEVATTGNFDYLKVNKEDNVSDEQLQLAWLSILDEYFTISKNNMALIQFRKKTELIFLEKKLQVLEILKFCINRNINVTDQLKEYKTSKEKISIHIGMIKNDISRISKSLPQEEIKKDNSEFDRSIAVLSQAGFKIDRFTTVVSEWVQMLDIFQQQNKPKN